MSYLELPWSYSAAIITFGIFFFSLNVYIFTLIMSHPFASPLWIVLAGVGLIGFAFSLRMARIHQEELVLKKQEEQGLS
ncbi:MAG: hypothetical protein ACFFED_11070 [Candidatus Thorarchaeota archaeon]